MVLRRRPLFRRPLLGRFRLFEPRDEVGERIRRIKEERIKRWREKYPEELVRLAIKQADEWVEYYRTSTIDLYEKALDMAEKWLESVS